MRALHSSLALLLPSIEQVCGDDDDDDDAEKCEGGKHFSEVATLWDPWTSRVVGAHKKIPNTPECGEVHKGLGANSWMKVVRRGWPLLDQHFGKLRWTTVDSSSYARDVVVGFWMCSG